MKKQFWFYTRVPFISLVIVSLSLLAFVKPQADDLIELSQIFNGRSNARFGDLDFNKVTTLLPGTKGLIKRVSEFKGTGNYGICIELLNVKMPPGSDCLWVYYRSNRPMITTYKVQGNDRQAILRRWGLQGKVGKVDHPQGSLITQTQDLNDAQGVQVTSPTSAVPKLKVNSDSKPLNNELKISSGATSETDIILFQVLNHMNHFNQKQSTITNPQPPSRAETSCQDSDCQTTKLTYEQCSNENNYLDEEIASQSNQNGFIQSLFSQPIRSQISLQCVQVSLATTSSSSKFYQYCPTGEGVPNQSVPRPCASERYVKLVSKSFDLLSFCLKDFMQDETGTVRENLFALMSLESGLNINARSPLFTKANGQAISGGAGGPGQLTQVAIADINRTEHEKLVKFLSNHNNQSCSQILKETISQPMESSYANSCSRISLAGGNPLKNMAYVFAIQKKLKSHIENFLFNDDNYKELFSKLGESDKNKLASDLAVWSHNAGLGGILQPLETYLTREHLEPKKEVKSKADIANFLTGLKQYLHDHPHRQNSSSARRRETSIFFDAVQNRYARIKEATGGQSCLKI